MCILIDCGVFFDEGVRPKDLKCSCGYGYRNILQDCFVDNRDRPDPDGSTIPRKAKGIIERAQKNPDKFEAYVRAQFVLHAASCGLRRQLWYNEPKAGFDEATLLRGFGEVVDAHRGNYTDRGQTEVVATPSIGKSTKRLGQSAANPDETTHDALLLQRSDSRNVPSPRLQTITSINLNVVGSAYSSSPRLSSSHLEQSRPIAQERSVNKPSRSDSITSDRHGQMPTRPRTGTPRERQRSKLDREPADNDSDDDTLFDLEQVDPSEIGEFSTVRTRRDSVTATSQNTASSNQTQSLSPMLRKLLSYDIEALDSIASFVRNTPEVLSEKREQLIPLIRDALRQRQIAEAKRIAQRLAMLSLSKGDEGWFRAVARSRKAQNELEEAMQKLLKSLARDAQESYK